jgi:hypothetical protein
MCTHMDGALYSSLVRIGHAKDDIYTWIDKCVVGVLVANFNFKADFASIIDLRSLDLVPGILEGACELKISTWISSH